MLKDEELILGIEIILNSPMDSPQGCPDHIMPLHLKLGFGSLWNEESAHVPLPKCGRKAVLLSGLTSALSVRQNDTF